MFGSVGRRDVEIRCTCGRLCSRNHQQDKELRTKRTFLISKQQNNCIKVLVHIKLVTGF